MAFEIEEGKQEYGTVVTKYGETATANAWIWGRKVEIARFAVGDGNGAYYIPDNEMTELKNEVWSGRITEIITDDETPNQVKVYTVIPFDVGGFIIREAAIFDTEGKMVAICNFPDLKKAAVESGAVSDFRIYMTIIFTHLDSIEWIIDPYVIPATKDDIEVHNRAPDAHENRFAAIETMHNLVRIEHGLDCHPLIMAGRLQYGLGMGGFGDGPLGGTEMEQIAARAVWHDRDSLTVKTVKSVVDLGVPVLHQLGPASYTVTFEGNDVDSVYIELYPSGLSVPIPSSLIEQIPSPKKNGGIR